MKGFCIWITGLSGAGKTTLARALAEVIPASVVIDGDEIRLPGQGFSRLDRDGNVYHAAYLAKKGFIRNKFSTTAHVGQVTVYKEDDTTEAYTKTLTTDANADPIVEG